MARAVALKISSIEPPLIWVSAAALIADATPHSAWQPATAPARATLFDIILPVSPAVIKAFICSSSVKFNSSETRLILKELLRKIRL